MKKLLVLLLIFSLIFSLNACADTTDPTDGSTGDPTSVPALTEPQTTAPSETEYTEPTSENVAYDLPMTAISITEETEAEYDDNGELIFEYTYQNIRIILLNADKSMSVNLDILNRIDATRANATEVMNDAINDSPAYPYYYSVIYTPMRADEAVISLFCQQTTYSGGMTIHSGSGLTYDLSSGNILMLEDILRPGITADTICPLVVQALSELPDAYYIYSDYADTVESRFSGNFLEDTGWHLSDEGLCFTFAPYEVAPNSSGFIHAVIPYDQLTGILEDAWFPPEQITPNGTLHIAPFSQESTETFDTLAEINLDRESDMYLLTTDGIIYQLVVESGLRRSDGFTPLNTVFRSNNLTSANGVTLQASPDSLALLRVTYTGADGPVELYFSVDESGNLIVE